MIVMNIFSVNVHYQLPFLLSFKCFLQKLVQLNLQITFVECESLEYTSVVLQSNSKIL